MKREWNDKMGAKHMPITHYSLWFTNKDENRVSRRKILSFLNMMKRWLHIVHLCQQFFTKTNFSHLFFTTAKNLLCFYQKTASLSKILWRTHTEQLFYKMLQTSCTRCFCFTQFHRFVIVSLLFTNCVQRITNSVLSMFIAFHESFSLWSLHSVLSDGVIFGWTQRKFFAVSEWNLFS